MRAEKAAAAVTVRPSSRRQHPFTHAPPYAEAAGADHRGASAGPSTRG
jgi:hypothetical protein